MNNLIAIHGYCHERMENCHFYKWRKLLQIFPQRDRFHFDRFYYYFPFFRGNERVKIDFARDD